MPYDIMIVTFVVTGVSCLFRSTRTHAQALAGWFVVWAALVSIPPGHSEQKNVIRMNVVRQGERRKGKRPVEKKRQNFEVQMFVGVLSNNGGWRATSPVHDKYTMVCQKELS